MAIYTAEILWRRNGEDFLGQRYSRRHEMRFDGGAVEIGHQLTFLTRKEAQHIH